MGRTQSSQVALVEIAGKVDAVSFCATCPAVVVVLNLTV